MGSANSGNARGGGNENGNQSSNYQQADLDGPPKVMALMPSFLRGGNVGIGNISSGGANQSSGSTNQMNLQKSRGERERGDRDRDRERDRDRGGRYDRSYNDYVNNNNMPPPRHRQSGEI
jgi:hypothetical protein